MHNFNNWAVIFSWCMKKWVLFNNTDKMCFANLLETISWISHFSVILEEDIRPTVPFDWHSL